MTDFPRFEKCTVPPPGFLFEKLSVPLHFWLSEDNTPGTGKIITATGTALEEVFFDSTTDIPGQK